MYFEIHKNVMENQYWWTIMSAGSNALLCQSEPLPSKSACIEAISIVSNHASQASYYDRTGE